jgi:hypothetical protein
MKAVLNNQKTIPDMAWPTNPLQIRPVNTQTGGTVLFYDQEGASMANFKPRGLRLRHTPPQQQY